MSGDACVIHEGVDGLLRVEYKGKVHVCQEVIVEYKLNVIVWLVNEGEKDDMVEVQNGDYLKIVGVNHSL